MAPVPALAETVALNPMFAATALVTGWSLPSPRSEFALPKPAFGPRWVREPEPATSAPDQPQSTALIDAPSAPAVGQRAAEATEAIDGPLPEPHAVPPTPAIAGREIPSMGSRRGFTSYDRPAPYRMPQDIQRLEIAYQLLNAMDGATTVACLRRSDCEERNPIFGRRPKTAVVLGAKVLSGAVHYWAMRAMAPDHPRLARFFGWFSVTLQGSVVGLNVSQLI